MDTKNNKTTGLVVAGLSGGSGKSVVAVGLAAAFARRGEKVAPFKKGPDYIDAGWLQLVSGRPCYNLDPYLMSPETILASLARHAAGTDRVIVEGNRGLYDGVDAAGGYSTAELAVLLQLPVFLVVDCTKTTRTVAAMVLGCRELDRRVDIRGVVLNRVGTARQETLIREAVERYTAIPVVGAVPRLAKDVFPQRHLGVTPHQEHAGAGDIASLLADMTERYCDLEAIAQRMAPLRTESPRPDTGKTPRGGRPEPVRIGVVRDAAFQFYYPENLSALEEAGAELVNIDALHDATLPEVDGLYIGGGFPETSAPQLAANRSFREALRAGAEAGLPIYAECGGLIYLGRSILLEGEEFELSGVLPIRFGLARKPQAHGYTRLKVEGDNPFYPRGLEIAGHEFRYSTVLEWPGDPANLALQLTRGVGFQEHRDGLVYRNVLALYSHIHALATPEWAPALVGRARQWRREQ